MRFLRPLLLILSAFASGMVVALLGMALVAGGYGWIGAACSVSAVVTAPVAACAWIWRRRRWGRAIAIVVVVTNVLIDAFLVHLTQPRDVDGLLDVGGSLVILWAVLWIGWQLVPVAALRRGATAMLVLLAAVPLQAGELFDDFHYTTHKQLAKRGWIVRTKAGWPGVPGATWGSAGVTFHKGIIKMTAATDGTPANTRQVQLCHERKYLNGTYAARVRFTDPAHGDHLVETFYLISPLREPMAPEYSEIDFEYLPNGGWGRKGPTLFATTWETFHPEPQWKADNVHETKSASYAGWRTLVVQVAEGKVRYFVDGTRFAEHSGDVFPESLMSINFNLWIIRSGLLPAGERREYEQELDWVYHAADAVVESAEIDKRVAALRKKKVSFRDTVPRPTPPLESPCDF
jgi:hypothetical protein